MATKSFHRAILLSFFLFISSIIFGQTVPPAPTGLRVTATECGKISLAWDDYGAGVEETGFEIYRSELTENLNFVNIGNVGSNITTFDDLGYLDFGKITSNKTYQYFVIGKFSSNSSQLSEKISGQFVCPKPQTPILSYNSCGKIIINWGDFLEPLQENQFEIYRADNENAYFNFLGRVNSNIFTFTDSMRLVSNKNYYYKIKGRFNGVLTEFSDATSGSMNCVSPNNLRITLQNCEKIDLEWDTLPAEINETSFGLFRSEHINGNYELINNTIPANSNTVTTYSPNTSKNYYYKILSIFKNGNYSGLSNAVSKTYNCTIPNTLRVANVSCGKITLNWDDNPQETPETGYLILKSFISESGENIKIVAGKVGPNVLSFTDDGTFDSFIQNFQFTTFTNIVDKNEALIPNKIYTYSLVSIFGNSFSTPSQSITSSFNCLGNLNLSLVDSNCNDIILNWVNSNSNSGITSYDIYKTVLDDTRYISIGGVNTIFLSEYENIFQITGRVSPNINNFQMLTRSLIAGKIYNFIVVARSNNAIVGISNSIQVSFSCYPSILLAQNTTDCEKVQLSWSDYPAGLNETSFNIYRSETGLENDFEILTSVGPNILTFNDIGNFKPLLSNITYYYKVAGVFDRKTVEKSNTVSASFACGLSPELSVVETGCGKVLLSWTPNPNFINKFLIYRSSDGENGTYKIVANTSFNQFADFGTSTEPIDANKIYHYKIAQYITYAGVISNYSNIISVQTTCASPKNPIATSVSCDLINLSWEIDPLQGKSGSFYNIFRSENGKNGEYQFLGTSLINSFKDYNNLIFGQEYYYKIYFQVGNNDFNYPIYISNKTDFISVTYFLNTLKSGPWTDPTTWSCGRVPTSLDEIIIDPNHIITLDENVIGNAKNLINNGQLIFGTGANLILNSP